SPSFPFAEGLGELRAHGEELPDSLNSSSFFNKSLAFQPLSFQPKTLSHSQHLNCLKQQNPVSTVSPLNLGHKSINPLNTTALTIPLRQKEFPDVTCGRTAGIKDLLKQSRENLPFLPVLHPPGSPWHGDLFWGEKRDENLHGWL
uniref:Uncharacterized protein n=1 Tax=Zonotrichia albicollis TaxID=44394 RepID=A0A8D2NDT9_ZONAL